MAFFDSPRFPGVIGLGAQGGPSYLVEIVETRGGQEQRNLVQSRPRQRYTISLVNRPASELETAVGFFHMTKGRLHGFRFKDPLDFTATSSTGILTAIAGSPQGLYQAYKRYTSGSETFDRKIGKLVSGTISVYENGSPMGSGFSIDHNSGIVTIPSAVGTYTWSGEFDVPVRFDSDIFKPGFIAISAGEYLGTVDSLELVEILV
jgi:uncharacterized protein (TIGR02217 family)